MNVKYRIWETDKLQYLAGLHRTCFSSYPVYQSMLCVQTHTSYHLNVYIRIYRESSLVKSYSAQHVVQGHWQIFADNRPVKGRGFEAVEDLAIVL